MKTIPVRHISATQTEPVSEGRFKIRDIQEVLDGKDLVHDLHRHDFFFILALQKGEGIHEIDFVSYIVHNHSIFILRPGQVHQLQLKSGCKGFLLEFDSSFYYPKDTVTNQRLVRAGNKNYCEFEENRFQKLLNILDCMFNEFIQKQEGYIAVIKANLDIFFVEFIRQSISIKGEPGNKHSYAQERYEDFLEQLELHISTHKQVSQYADMLNLSIYQLNAITKAIAGNAASEVINKQIVLEAKRYLLGTSNQVKDIADILGYEDISYFIRFFKKHTGYSPDLFRKNFR